ncbi:hypothetical protein WR25_05783 [Diploscapter pachys]|uniref:Uncharacterized protein n=1 Tax=Diploscapter pachys TaxID=2018661 RepID=A0A2A2K563_9BILA|nr:hypothetical protein WR25_05783 [Diploscapter pachys]
MSLFSYEVCFVIKNWDDEMHILDPEDRCVDDVDPGPCQHYQTKWFWDKQDETCKEFHYGGCMGNSNRFHSRQECIKMCRYKMFNPVAVPDLCLLEPAQGFCGDDRAGQWWFYFNSETGICEKFFYYGCGGNDNKFYSLHMCRKVCAERLSPQIACDQCDIRTSFCKSHGKYNYTCECRTGYEKTAYGECVDIDECRGFTAVCDKNAWCTNTVGGYTCECMAAYRGTGKHCTYAELPLTVEIAALRRHVRVEYASARMGIRRARKERERSWSRERDTLSDENFRTPLYQGDGFNCTDVNECLKMPHICDKNAECINREGSFICTCLEGYAGNGYNCTSSKNACLDKFDHGYTDTCGKENWRPHFYFDHQTRICPCLRLHPPAITGSVNLATQLHLPPNMSANADSILLTFKPCCTSTHTQSDSRNIFDDALTCQWLCEAQPMYKSRACLEDFDEGYKGECNGGRWRQQWYFDKNIKRCVAFWYDGCRGQSQNIFQDEMTCLAACENPSKKDPRKPWHNRDKFKMKEILGDIYKPNHTDKCLDDDPCQNNGTCIYVWKTDMYYCKCKPGYIGKECQTRIAFDPCSSDPCKNGGSCQMVEPEIEGEKPTFECYCSPGFGGPTCDQRPCDTNPCKNNGTCRTTRAFSSYFCDCPPTFGGKNCDIAIGSSPPEDRYYNNKNMELISSGKEQWIAQMREKFKASGGLTTGGASAGQKPSADEAGKGTAGAGGDMKEGHIVMTIADAPYKDPATKKREREEREKEAAEKLEKEKEEEEIKQKAIEEAKMEEERLQKEK